MTIYIVDRMVVEPDRHQVLLDIIKRQVIPVMTEAGMKLESCWATSAEIGEDVEIEVIWSCADHKRFNEIRRDLVLDKRWYAYAAELARIRKGGNRRFFYPTGLELEA